MELINRNIGMRSPLAALYALLWCLSVPAVATAAQGQPAVAPVQQQKEGRFEAEIAAYEAADRKSPPPAGAVLFIGSSSIRLWKTLPQDFPELTVINRGFGGSEIADSIRCAGRILIPHRPKMVVLYAGGNDLNRGVSPLQVVRDFRAFVDAVHAALPETRIVYVSINPSVARWKQEDRVLLANRLIAEYVRDNDGKAGRLSYIDSHSRLLSPAGEPRPEILRADGLHLNDAGYALWTAVLKPEILALAARDRPAGASK
jgi:lysophospholipase L1-like esterase